MPNMVSFVQQTQRALGNLKSLSKSVEGWEDELLNSGTEVMAKSSQGRFAATNISHNQTLLCAGTALLGTCCSPLPPDPRVKYWLRPAIDCSHPSTLLHTQELLKTPSNPEFQDTK